MSLLLVIVPQHIVRETARLRQIFLIVKLVVFDVVN